MPNIISNQVKADLDKLIDIAYKYREGDISESLFYDVISKYIKQENEYAIYIEYLQSKNVKITNGEPPEGYSNDYEDIVIQPYDTTMIDISPKPLSLDMIIARLENDEIDLMPDFQRRSGLWSDEQKSRLIESLLLRIPLPAFYFDGNNNDRWIVIDGLQRLTTLKDFFVDQTLHLTGLEFLTDLNGSGFKDMPRVYTRRMKETQIITYIINPGAPINLKYNIFKRINTGGLELEPQEIRHALYQGFATKLLQQLANMEKFKEATGYSISSERMMDREFVLRFIAFHELKIDNYKGSVDLFLNAAMDYINKNYTEEYGQRIMRLFELVLDVSQQIFGKFAFRKMPDRQKRRPISKALFETWTSILADYSIEDLQLLVEKKENICAEYESMCLNDKEFIDSIGSGKVSAARKRNEKIKCLIEGMINND